MAKNAPAAKTAAAKTVAPKVGVKVEAKPAKEAKVSLAKMRGPKGVPETAKITILTDGGANPKRPSSKAFAAFACYKNGMTTGQFCDAVNAIGQEGMGTPNLTYDASHGFIKIEGYEPKLVEAKPKKEKAPKAEGATAPKSAPKSKPVAAKKEKAAADTEAKEEVMD